MLKFEMMTEMNEMKNLSNKVLGHKKLPLYLHSEKKHLRLVIGMIRENTPIGLVYGVIEKQSNVLFLNFLYIKKEHRSYLAVLSLLKSAFKTAIDIKGIKSAVWKYTLETETDEADSRLKLLLDIPFCHFRKLERLHQFKIKTVDIHYIRQFKIYNPTLWRTKGYEVLAWSNCEDDLLDQVKKRELEQPIIRDRNYTSPFNKNATSEYDVYDSYVLIEPATNAPMGWIMCSVISEEEIVIRNFYMYKEVRSVIVAHSFITYILDVIALRFKYLSFNVIDGNRQMEMIVKKYFKPILEASSIKCNASVDFLFENDGKRGE